jgi:hypothetical protein
VKKTEGIKKGTDRYAKFGVRPVPIYVKARKTTEYAVRRPHKKGDGSERQVRRPTRPHLIYKSKSDRLR